MTQKSRQKNSKHFNKKQPSKKANNRNEWIYGKHAVTSALNNPLRKHYKLLSTENSLSSIENLAPHTLKDDSGNAILEIVTSQQLHAILPENAVHQGIALKSSPLPDLDIEDIHDILEQGAPIILLDQVTDPHNIGAILRSAAAFGAGAVIITRNNAPTESATIAKVACGAMDAVPLVKVTNLAQTIEALKDYGYWTLGLDGYADTTLAEAKKQGKIALVMGAEGKGLRRLTRERCDQLVKLPISNLMESLNVSNAAAISLYELARD